MLTIWGVAHNDVPLCIEAMRIFMATRVGDVASVHGMHPSLVNKWGRMILPLDSMSRHLLPVWQGWRYNPRAIMSLTNHMMIHSLRVLWLEWLRISHHLRIIELLLGWIVLVDLSLKLRLIAVAMMLKLPTLVKASHTIVRWIPATSVSIRETFGPFERALLMTMEVLRARICWAERWSVIATSHVEWLKAVDS